MEQKIIPVLEEVRIDFRCSRVWLFLLVGLSSFRYEKQKGRKGTGVVVPMSNGDVHAVQSRYL